MISRCLLAGFFAVAGVNHFISPAPYVAIMPPVFSAPELLVAISGAAEIVGGVAILIPALRVVAGWGLIALLIGVFPANIYAALHGMQIGGAPVAPSLLWARLPLQPLLIAWVYFTCCKPRGVPR